MNVAAFTGGINDPSSRYRIRQYIDVLKDYGITIDDIFSMNGKYPPKEKNSRLIWGAITLAERMRQVINVNLNSYDCVFLQRELFSTFKTFENLTPRPRILDVDDAIHLYRGGNYIKKIAHSSDVIICGNNNLANVYEKWNNKIFILPTAVDTSKYVPNINKVRSDEKVQMGWIGTSGGFQYLYDIEEALYYLLSNNENLELLIVSDSKPKFKLIDNYNFIEWDEKTEVKYFQDIDIGLMPLSDDEWSRGKCSYKMLLYMSCGSPVVVSPIGMNREVLEQGMIGFGPKDYYSDWIESIDYLIRNRNKRLEMGESGQKVVQENYSIDVLSKKMSEIILNLVR